MSGGNLIKYPGYISNSIVETMTIKPRWDILIFKERSRYILMDVNYFNLITESMIKYENIQISLNIIPD